MTTPLTDNDTGKGWALRLVATWCEHRANQTEERKLLKRCRMAYKQGPMAVPTELFALALSDMIDENSERWTNLASQMRDKANKLDDNTNENQR